ncbi:MAG: hypothetical protein ACYC4N_27675 [Pirellulaceae bacterium]
MRLPEAKIKQAILNPELDIRQRAIRYFSVCHSDDEGVVPLVIQAIEKYGREDAYHLVGSSVDLRQTEETVSWIVDELNDPDSDRYENYTFNLTRVLCHADPALLVHREEAILESRHFLRDCREDFTRRLQPLSWDEAECWRRLEEICEAGKGKQYSNEVDMSFANNILEAMARIGGTSADRVLAILSQKVDDFENNPMKWLEPLMVRFAGLLRLEAAVPLIVGKLHEDDDLLAERGIEALSRIASDTVVAAVAEDFAGAKRHFRLYATDVLESVHSDLAVQKSLDLLAREQHRHIQERLAHAALSHFSVEAIEPVRQWLSSQQIRGELCHLRDYLLVTCTIMEERFPEYDEWRAAGDQERKEHRRQLEALAGDPQATLLFAFERAKDYFPTDESDEKAPPVSKDASVDERLRDGGSSPAVQRVGRNCSNLSSCHRRTRYRPWPWRSRRWRCHVRRRTARP